MESEMYVQIEVIRGPATGYRVDVSPETPLVIGRATGIGLSINGDLSISRQHCEVTVVPPDCHLTSLSSNGTFVNGHPITKIMLIEGDEISIGHDTLLRVHMTDRSDTDLATRHEPFSLKGALEESPTYAEEVCASGLSRFNGAQELPGPWDVAQALATRGRLYAIVDFQRLGAIPPATLTRDAMLFDWFPPEAPVESSPLLLEFNGPLLEPLVKEAWDNDGIALLQSQVDPTELMKHLRSTLKLNAQGKPQANPQGMLGICWPSVLQQLLVLRSAEFVQTIMTGIDSVLVPAPESPSRWQILAPANFAALLEELGMQKAPTLKGKKK